MLKVRACPICPICNGKKFRIVARYGESSDSKLMLECINCLNKIII